ncbi:uncharacterized protein DNG_06793 [Cephalotrichum gorgonifer]|uniref:BZIP domain-containing protein n=1 Tax=Cephalotrichum gorgonifer TaxID=2041049 RepID=A0AAE8SWS8_9PEZI|nr:uncharacterized protein DNG_06793 [Cephalotrichum gorgonifer]
MQNKTVAAVTRNRDHQRRSRARRREYMEDLQQRLQQYERRGVEASLEMQQASRAVVLENQMLRGLLHARGVSQEEIDVYRQLFSGVGRDAETIPGNDSSRHAAPIASTKSRQPSGNTPKYSDVALPEMIATPRRTNIISSPPSTSSSSSTPRTTEPLEASLSLDAIFIPPAEELEDSTGLGVGSHDNYGGSPRAPHIFRRDPTKLWDNCPEATTRSGSDILPPMPDCYCPPDVPVTTSSLTMTAVSCEVAVGIIVELRCYMDSAQARELLDCGGIGDCLVQNSKLFRILDMIA